MNDLPSLDLYTLSLIRLVAKHRGFTAASKEAGISQSALTRQVQGLEAQIGVQLFERTTRVVSLTEAGAVLLRETEPLPNILSGALRRIREEFLEGPREIRVGLSSSLSQAHIPGIFHAHQKANSEIPVIVSQEKDDEIVRLVATAGLDVGIVTEVPNLPAAIEVTHEMNDEFCAVAPAETEVPGEVEAFRPWARNQNWLLPPAGSGSRILIDEWSRRSKITMSAAMELESFDLMDQFVALGMGCALVPQRSLSVMLRKHQIHKVKLPRTLSRRLIVIVPRHGRTPEHVKEFVKGILFS